jgi:DNA-binding PadR family transcriptional regulator
MTRTKRLILTMLQAGEWTGRELVRASNRKLGAGTVYVFLLQLEEAGHVSSRVLAPDSVRRGYRITDAGRAALRAVTPPRSATKGTR